MKTQIKKNDIWLADLNPRMGTEPGKTRPVLIVQTNLLNSIPHPSTLICPITSNILTQSQILRVNLPMGTGNLKNDCDVLIDQIRAIDNRRLIRKIGSIPDKTSSIVERNLKIVLDF